MRCILRSLFAETNVYTAYSHNLACNGTVVSGNEVHFSVPTNLQTNSLFGTESPPISLCYGVLGDDNKYFNLISNAGASVNAHYHKAANTAGDVANIIDQIAIKAVDVRGLTHNISVNLSCLAQINGADVERYDSDGIVVRRTTNQSVLVWVPNCSPSNYPLKIQITCQSPPLANTSGGLNLIVDERINANPKTHGIIGKSIRIYIARNKASACMIYSVLVIHAHIHLAI